MTALTLTGVLVLVTAVAAGLLVVSAAIARWLLRDDEPAHPTQDWSHLP